MAQPFPNCKWVRCPLCSRAVIQVCRYSGLRLCAFVRTEGRKELQPGPAPPPVIALLKNVVPSIARTHLLLI